MTNKPAHKNQVGQPSDNGGHFAAKTHDEAPEVTLSSHTGPSAAMELFNETSRLAFEADQRHLNATVAAMREQVKIGAPTAVKAVFTWVDDFDSSFLVFSHALDADGNQVDLDADAEGEVRHMGRSFTDSSDARSRFDHDRDAENPEYTMDVTATADPQPTVTNATARVASIAEDIQSLQKQLGAAGADGIAAIARQDYPGAASVLVIDGNDGPGAPYFAVCSVEDKDGKPLADEAPGSYDIADKFGAFSPLLDRDMSLLEETVVDGARLYRLKF